MPKIGSLLVEAAQALSNSATPTLDARVLLAHVLEVSKEHLSGYPEQEVPENKAKEFNQLVSLRQKNKPVAKIIGVKEFWGLDFIVDENVLDPRPDSETLIESVLRHFPEKDKDYRIIDLGIGSGCLLTSLLHEFKNAHGTGVDVSLDALDIARKNAEKNNVAERCNLTMGNWFYDVSGQFDVIISNPPYIKTADIKTLSQEVSQYDPVLALDGGVDGLEDYRKIISQLKSYLAPGGKVFFEIGEGQSADVQKILTANGFLVIDVVKDLAGIERCIVASSLT